jgi:hypothetical protein
LPLHHTHQFLHLCAHLEELGNQLAHLIWKMTTFLSPWRGVGMELCWLLNDGTRKTLWYDHKSRIKPLVLSFRTPQLP